MKRKNLILVAINVAIFSGPFASCSSASASSDVREEIVEFADGPKEERSEEQEVSEQETENQTQDPKLPAAKVQLPSLPFDKAKLPTVQKLDAMITEEAKLQAAYNAVYQGITSLKEKTETSMSGTAEDQVKAILTMVNAVEHFDAYSLEVAKESMQIFRQAYATDADFESAYRDTYYAARAEVSGEEDLDAAIIADDVKRREVTAHFSNGYLVSLSSDLRAMEELIKQRDELTQKVIGKVTSQANIDMMVADYKKGKQLTEMLNGTIAKLKMVQPLDPENSAVKDMIAQVENKKKSRQEEVMKALAEYRFPDQYSGGNAPSNTEELENRMKSFLSKFKYDYVNDKNYEVLDIRVAGPWIKIYDVWTEEHLYSQIDYYVAVPAVEGNGVVDVLLVTGKTSGAHQGDFGNYSVGGIGQMMRSNL